MNIYNKIKSLIIKDLFNKKKKIIYIQYINNKQLNNKNNNMNNKYNNT